MINTDDLNQEEMKSSSAFIFYWPKPKGGKGEAFYNIKAWEILKLTLPVSQKKESLPPSPDIASFCKKWKELYDKKIDVFAKKGDVMASEDYILEIIQSKKRRYLVKGTVLSNTPLKHENKQYLFILERVRQDNLNTEKIFRKWNLSPREQEIARLLFADRSNKEIARELGLSINTIKGYMKLLMRKLDVNSRAGIISRLVAGV